MSTLGKIKKKQTVTYDNGVITVTAYKPKIISGPPKPKAGKSAKEARQEHRATKKASRQRKREHRKSRKNK
jgi:hypothetical protein